MNLDELKKYLGLNYENSSLEPEWKKRKREELQNQWLKEAESMGQSMAGMTSLPGSMEKSLAEKVINSVPTVEAQTALRKTNPEGYKKYLQALENVYGDVKQRMIDMGFSPDIYYHGTKEPFDEFKPSSGGSAGKSVYLTENKNIAERYRPEGGAMFKGHIRNDNIMDLTVSDKTGLKNLESAADKLGIRDEFDKMKFKGGNAYYDLIRAYENKYPNFFEGLKGTERENAFTEKVKELTGANGFKFSQNGIENYSTNVFDPKDIRSTKAAFDPRFKDSSNIMAGAAAGIPMMLPENQSQPIDENELKLKLLKQMSGGF